MVKEKRKRSIKDEDLINFLKGYIDKSKHMPTKEELKSYNKQLANAIFYRWGLNEAIKKAGYEPLNIHNEPYKKFYKADMITLLEMTMEEITKFTIKNDRLPTAREFYKLNLPHFNFYHDKFDCKYNEFLVDICGYDEEFLSSSSSR